MNNTQVEGQKTRNTADQAKRGETRNTGFFTIQNGFGTVLVNDARCGKGKVVLVMPMNASAGGSSYWVSEVSNGYFEVKVNNSVGNKEFGYAIFGENNNRA